MFSFVVQYITVYRPTNVGTLVSRSNQKDGCIPVDREDPFSISMFIEASVEFMTTLGIEFVADRSWCSTSGALVHSPPGVT